MEANYCIDTTAGQIDCLVTLVPQFAEAMSSADFPWLHAIVAIITILSLTL